MADTCPDCGRPRGVLRGQCNAYDDPDGTDCLRLAYEREKAASASLRADLEQANTALSLVSGALADTGSIQVGPALEFGDGIRALTRERDEARAAVCEGCGSPLSEHGQNAGDGDGCPGGAALDAGALWKRWRRATQELDEQREAKEAAYQRVYAARSRIEALEAQLAAKERERDPDESAFDDDYDAQSEQAKR